MKTTGIELIAKERQEQIEKHGFTLGHDIQVHSDDEALIDCARYLISDNEMFYPEDWGMKTLEKLRTKTEIEKLVVAGALIAAEIDRLRSE